MQDHTTLPTSQEIPYGYCHCGCGQLATIAKKTSKRRGQVKGEPCRYIPGHNEHANHSLENPNPSGLCMCGCGRPTLIATKTSVHHGWLKGYPKRFINGHNGYTPIEERFWKYVQKSPDGCWLWTGGKTKSGYGVLNRGGHNGSNVGAHCFSYELHYGPIPKGKEVCHHCDTPSCVRPDHLFAGTHSQNMVDMLSKGRQGESGPKLTRAKVLEMRRRFADGASIRDLAQEYGLTPRAASDAIRSKTWRKA